MVLEREGIEVVAAVGDTSTLLREAMAEQPDLVVTDIRMPPGNPTTAYRTLCIRATRCRGRAWSCRPSMSCADTRSSSWATARVASASCANLRVSNVESFTRDLQSVPAGRTVLRSGSGNARWRHMIAFVCSITSINVVCSCCACMRHLRSSAFST